MALQVVILAALSGVVSAIAAFFDLFPTWAKIMLSGLLVWKIGTIEIAGFSFSFVDDLIKFIFSPLAIGVDSFKIGVGLFAAGIILLLFSVSSLK